ncbi:MAG: Rne/Rng family ribonuclease [Bacteroidetes bacterium]|nr:MAG: Rne/Rng family ribonuclease [Bacteroidota bacterium]
MSNELFINSTQNGNRIALLQEKRLVEYHLEGSGDKFNVGDIYLGIVTKVVPGLNAAFVDIGYEKDAFLHYHDLGPNIRTLNSYVKNVQGKQQQTHKLGGFKIESEIDKGGKIDKVLTKGQQILVQVVKEPISTKGPRLSCEISIAGRYLVLVPFTDSISVSKKISQREERQRLQRLITSIKPDNFSVIIRTVAEQKEVAELDRDLKNLVKKWEDGFNKLKTAKPKDVIISEMDRTASILRDMLNESFDNIYIDDKTFYEETKTYIKSIAPEKEKIVKLHAGKEKLFEQTGIERQLKALFGRTVSLPGGGYLIIEHTEAMHVVDVNSGNKSNQESDQEKTAININLESAKEVARQLRLRDLGGIIVIDFIDMKDQENRNVLYNRMKAEMEGDRAKYTILPLSKFGIMQITRQRVRPQLTISTSEVCPSCNGTGKITASVLVTDEIESKLEHLLTKQNEKDLTIEMHPFVYAHYTKGVFSKRFNWFLKYKTWIKLEKNTALGIIDYRFRNKFDEIDFGNKKKEDDEDDVAEILSIKE